MRIAVLNNDTEVKAKVSEILGKQLAGTKPESIN